MQKYLNPGTTESYNNDGKLMGSKVLAGINK